MTIAFNNTIIFELELPDNSPIYDKYGRRTVDDVLDSLRLTLPHVIPKFPYDARFLLWLIWQGPHTRHPLLGNILADLVRDGYLPLVPGEKCGGTLIPYFLK